MTQPTGFLQSSLVDEATFLRGRIVTSYAQIEFLLGDISVKLSMKFPYFIDKRIKEVKRIAERKGYEAYRDELDRMCGELLRYTDLRHFMVHGFMELETDSNHNHSFRLRRYIHEGDGFRLVIATTTLENLRRAADDITGYVSHAVSLFRKIYLEQRLEK